MRYLLYIVRVSYWREVALVNVNNESEANRATSSIYFWLHTFSGFYAAQIQSSNADVCQFSVAIVRQALEICKRQMHTSNF